jgi:hypothetical protein
MTDVSQYQLIGSAETGDFYAVDPDIILIIPKTGLVDTRQAAQVSADFLSAYARKLGKKCATIVVMTSVSSQDADARRTYGELIEQGLFFGVAIVVDSPLSRAIGNFVIGFTRSLVPTKLFDKAESAIEWLRTLRPA